MRSEAPVSDVSMPVETIVHLYTRQPLTHGGYVWICEALFLVYFTQLNSIVPSGFSLGKEINRHC